MEEALTLTIPLFVLLLFGFREALSMDSRGELVVRCITLLVLGLSEAVWLLINPTLLGGVCVSLITGSAAAHDWYEARRRDPLPRH